MCILPFATTEPAIPKLLYVGDNKSALRIRMGLHLPNAKCEYLTAKYQRTIGWAEETAFTKHWPTAALDLPGESNNLADLFCRFANMFADRLINPLPVPRSSDSEDEDSEFEDFKLIPHTPAASSLGEYFSIPPPCVMVKTRSSDYEGSPPESPLTDDTTPTESITHPFGTSTNTPAGYTTHIFPLTPTQWKDLSSGYTLDKTEYNAVSIADLFAAATNKFEGSQVVSKRAKSWLGKVFFLLNISTGLRSTAPVLFTPASTTKPALNVGIGYSTHLVMVIPKATTIRLSSRSDSNTFYADDTHEEWAIQNTTCSDILWLSHDSFTPHTSQATTIQIAKRMAWWPGIETDIRHHLAWCSFCSAQKLRLAPIGIGTRCLFPLLCWQIDDKIITDDDIVKSTGYVSILVMVEQTSGLTIYACRKTREAWEAAHLVHTRIVQYYGVPLQLLSDNAKDYISSIAVTLCSIMGIPNRITCSRGSHSKAAESAIRAVSKMITSASAKGDLRSSLHMDLYTANLQIKTNQIMESDGSTVFERLHGQPPITTADLLHAPHLTESQMLHAVSNTKNQMNTDYLKALHNRCTELISYRNEMSDKRAKWLLTNRLSNQANQPQASGDFTIDDFISFDGARWQIMRIQHSPDGRPIKDLIINTSDDFKWVRFDLLLPLSVPIQQNMLPISPAIEIGSTVFYYDTDDPLKNKIYCGDITDIQDDNICIQVRQHNDTARTYLPRWTLPSRPDSIYRFDYGNQKKNMVPFTDTTCVSDIICVTHLSKGNFMTDETAYYLRSKGIDVSIADDEECT